MNAPLTTRMDRRALLRGAGTTSAAPELMRPLPSVSGEEKVEFDPSAQDIRAIGIGTGVTGAELGLRLRYEFMREFAPYIGVIHEMKIGRTADFARAGGEHVSATGIVLGPRAWF